MKNIIYLLIIVIGYSCGNGKLSDNVEVIDIQNYALMQWQDLPKQITDADSLVFYENDSVFITMINDLKYINGNYYIKDWKNKQIVSFDKDGNIVNVLRRHGRGPGEYLNIADFDVDVDGNVYIAGGALDKLLIYDKSGELIKDTKLPFEIDLIKIISPNEYLVLICSWEEGEHKGKQMVSTDSLFNIIKVHTNYTPYKDDNFWLSSSYLKETEKGIFFHRQVSDSVYLFKSGDLEQIFLFDFKDQTIPLEDRKDIFKMIDSKEINRYRTLIDFTIIGDKYIYGTMFDDGERKIFIADRNKKVIYMQPKGIFAGTADNKIIQLDYSQEDDASNSFKLRLYNIL